MVESVYFTERGKAISYLRNNKWHIRPWNRLEHLIIYHKIMMKTYL